VDASGVTRVPRWAFAIPPAAILVLAIVLSVKPPGVVLNLLCVAALVGAVICAVRLAELVAARVGQPLSSLVLAFSVTALEVVLIVRLMLVSGAREFTLARETMFAVIMIVCNGLIGLCLLIGGLRYREQTFHVVGANAALATLIALATLALVLPNFTSSAPGPYYSDAQLAFASIASLVLWAAFVFWQTVSQREYFLKPEDGTPRHRHAPRPSLPLTWAAFTMLLVSLGAVVGLARAESPIIEAAVQSAHAPKGAVGVAIAILVLLPEMTAAVREALANDLQASLNSGLGAALASVGLTIPAVGCVSVFLHEPLVLGLDPLEMVLLALTFLVASITLVAGRTHIMLGAVHLVILAAFLLFAVVP